MTAESMLSGAEGVLGQIEEASQKSFLPIIGPVKGKLLAEEVHKAQPKHVLEVGTLIGYSAILMGREMAADSEMITIEIHEDEAELANLNIQRANVPPKINVIVGDALDVIATLHGPFDFAFIDAEKAEYLQYLKLAEPLLSSGAVIFADNAGVFADQMADYLSYVRTSGNYQSRYVELAGDGVEISVKI
ncbi:MAG: O-methyltransferase [Candidatus Bathyarchaeota archaeon]|nr:O-methyltransferase [Candidatus Bathyarchaeota archaeon]